jgi:sirohydrochlorin cobaltochelatase
MAVAVGCGGAAQQAVQTVQGASKPAIVLVAFGSSVASTQRTFEYIETRTRHRYPGHELHWAFTSSFIVTKLRRQGRQVFALEDVVEQLKRRGIQSAVFQSLHIVPGQEFEEIGAVNTDGLEVAIGAPLLASPQDIEATIEALTEEMSSQGPTVLVAHGNDRFPQFNEKLVAFDRRLQTRFPTALTCTVEGLPGMDGLERAQRQAQETGRIHFVPLMLVAGDHMYNDVLGDEQGSWKQIVAAPTTTHARPLGENDAVLDIFFQHLDVALAALSTGGAS